MLWQIDALREADRNYRTVTGLDFPSDLDRWRQWQIGQRGVKARVKGQLDKLPWHGRPPIRITSTHDRGCDVLIALDATTPTAILALLRPLEHLTGLAIRIASPASVADIVPRGEWREGHADLDATTVLATRAKVVLALGHYLPIGAAAYRGILASAPGKRAAFLTVQHGLLVPKAPPLAPDAHLLAWSGADADFWRSGRDDVTTTTVGSQLLWEAASRRTDTPPAPNARPVFLGQLHGAELDREQLFASTLKFCTEHRAIYRPHPAENDRRSRAWHEKLAAAGVEIDDGAMRLADLNAPIVSAFSTGILEAAAKRLPAWAYHDAPPAWLTEFWDRYGMHRYGADPTPAPTQPAVEPAAAIANVIIGNLQGA